MHTSQQSTVETRTFARIFGPFLVIIPLGAVVHASDMRKIASDFAANLLWCWVVGAFVFIIGLAAIALHQRWHGVPEVVISAVGWLIALKGLFLVVLPRFYLSVIDAALDSGSWWRAGLIAVSVIGVYLTYVGWAPASSEPVTRVADGKPDLPRPRDCEPAG